jgi:hypothetical protein
MNGLQFIEGRVAEGVGETVEVAEDIGAGGVAASILMTLKLPMPQPTSSIRTECDCSV